MRPILPGLFTLIVAAAMIGCGSKTPGLPVNSEVYGVTIDAAGEATTHYRIQTAGDAHGETIERAVPGIYCPNCKHHVPVLQSDPTRAWWLEQPPAAPPEPPARMRLRFVPGDECDCECCPAGPC